MRKEIKIALPAYKVAYSLCFIVILSLIRGITATYEVGIALEAPVAMLAAVCCADTYSQEISSKRGEVHRLFPMRKRVASILKRLAIQELFLLLLAALGYGLFICFQHPFIKSDNEGKQLVIFLAAIFITILFWSLLSNTLSCLFRNMWVGIGGCFLLWIFSNSSLGERAMGAWNLFSYTFRNIESGDFEWLPGKILSIFGCMIMVIFLPKILKKRG